MDSFRLYYPWKKPIRKNVSLFVILLAFIQPLAQKTATGFKHNEDTWLLINYLHINTAVRVGAGRYNLYIKQLKFSSRAKHTCVLFSYLPFFLIFKHCVWMDYCSPCKRVHFCGLGSRSRQSSISKLILQLPDTCQKWAFILSWDRWFQCFQPRWWSFFTQCY